MTIPVNRVWRLENPIQHYAWGSRTALAELCNRTVPSAEPEAELWMGAHPKAPSLALCDDHQIALPELIDHNPEAILGAYVARRFDGRLPFLFKVLAAGAPLSVQAHPNRRQAQDGYQRENRDGIPVDAPHRNYRDDNHKPEVICALTDFWGLNGFRTIEDFRHRLSCYCPKTLAPKVTAIISASSFDGWRQVFDTLLKLRDREKNMVLDEALGRAREADSGDSIAEWIIRLHDAYPEDTGILAPLYLNLVCLKPGQAMYLPAGQLHAYLEGVGIELMANSDNVLRGGLTPKHIDHDQLMRTIRFEPREPGVMTAQRQSPTQACFQTPAAEFILERLTIAKETAHDAPALRNVEILIVTSGMALLEVIATGERLDLQQGNSVLIPAAAGAYRLVGEAAVYRAGVPEPPSPGGPRA